jgi:aminoglycoside phosphotransferase (APT) family kinase protein
MALVHERMRAVADLDFTPRLVSTLGRRSFVVHGGHCWDVCGWMCGTPDLLNYPSQPQPVAAGRALGELHRGWLPPTNTFAPCSAVARRLQLFAEWERARFTFTGRPEEVAEIESSLELVRTRLPLARTALQRVAPIRGRMVGIHGDYWPENVLFQHERLTAVLDFGNIGFDHPEVDLGRLFADVPGADCPRIAAAVEAYNAAAPFDLSVPLVELLATTGRLGSLANWHLRLTAGAPDAGLLSGALPRVRRLVSLILAEPECQPPIGPRPAGGTINPTFSPTDEDGP